MMGAATIALFGCVAAIVVAGAKFAWAKWNGTGPYPSRMLVWSLVGAVVTGAATTIVSAVNA